MVSTISQDTKLEIPNNRIGFDERSAIRRLSSVTDLSTEAWALNQKVDEGLSDVFVAIRCSSSSSF